MAEYLETSFSSLPNVAGRYYDLYRNYLVSIYFSMNVCPSIMNWFINYSFTRGMLRQNSKLT